MDYRSGKCSQCGAEYKIPASFAHNVARCKVCKGVVHLGPVVGARASEARGPAREAERETGRAPDREARPDAGGGARPPAATPPQPKAPSPPAAEPRRAPEPAVPVPAPPAAAARRPSPPEPARDRPPVAAALPAVPFVPEKGIPADGKKTRLALLVVLAFVLAAALLFVFRAQVFGAAATVPQASADPAAPYAEKPAPSAPVPGASEAPQRAPVASTSVLPAAEPAHAASFERTSDTSPEEELAIEQWVAQWLDEDAGPAGAIAERELRARKHKVIPAVLNVLASRDLASDDGRAAVEACARLLADLAHEPGLAAAPGTHPTAADLEHQRARWSAVWTEAQSDPEAWLHVTRLDQQDPDEARALRAALTAHATEPAPR